MTLVIHVCNFLESPGFLKSWYYQRVNSTNMHKQTNYCVQVFILEKNKQLPYSRQYSVWPVLGSDPHLTTSCLSSLSRLGGLWLLALLLNLWLQKCWCSITALFSMMWLRNPVLEDIESIPALHHRGVFPIGERELFQLNTGKDLEISSYPVDKKLWRRIERWIGIRLWMTKIDSLWSDLIIILASRWKAVYI